MRDVIFIAERSNLEHTVPLTWRGKPMPILHRNARSRYITREEVMDVWKQETSRY